MSNEKNAPPIKPASAGDVLNRTLRDANAPTPAMILHTLKLREEQALIGITPTAKIEPLGKGGYEVAVAGPSVFIRLPTSAPLPEAGMDGVRDELGADIAQVLELPRQSVVLRWLVAADVPIEVIAARAPGEVRASPSPAMRAERARAAQDEATRRDRERREREAKAAAKAVPGKPTPSTART